MFITAFLVYCMLFGLLPIGIQETQKAINDHRTIKSLLKTASTKSPISDQSTYSSIQTTLEPRKRYGTYVESVNETCLHIKCAYDENSPDIWAREMVLVKAIPENERDTFVKKTLVEKLNQSDTREDYELLLTPSIITVWAYELGFALTEGRYLCIFDIYK